MKLPRHLNYRTMISSQQLVKIPSVKIEISRILIGNRRSNSRRERRRRIKAHSCLTNSLQPLPKLRIHSVKVKSEANFIELQKRLYLKRVSPRLLWLWTPSVEQESHSILTENRKWTTKRGKQSRMKVHNCLRNSSQLLPKPRIHLPKIGRSRSNLLRLMSKSRLSTARSGSKMLQYCQRSMSLSLQCQLILSAEPRAKDKVCGQIQAKERRLRFAGLHQL